MRGRETLRPATLCIHAGHRADEREPAVTLPIHQSSSFVPGEHDLRLIRAGRMAESLIYSRNGNPTVRAVEAKIAALEGAPEARLFSSGMAACHAALASLSLPGGHVLASNRLYGGSRELIEDGLREMGGSSSFVDITDLAAVEAALRDETRVLFCESIANPTLEVADLPRLAQLAHARGAALVVDATFASPILQRPLELGADVSFHSASKYLGGHTDLVGGVLCASKELCTSFHSWRTRAGGCLDPFAAYLLDRGLKTLALRMRAHCEGATVLAEALECHPGVKAVRYPGLASFPQQALAGELLSGNGGMLLLTIDGDDDAASEVVAALRIAVPGSSLGGVETLVSQPVLSSHTSLDRVELDALGIAPGAIRVSVGVEDSGDLVADFEAALASI